ncbi:MAG: VWA domain-containing protein [Paracoccaceae bacterium]
MRCSFAALIALTLGAASVTADQTCTQDAMIVFDGSGSMAEMGFNQIGEPRIFEARQAMADAIPGIAEVRRLGLIVYGPGTEDSCAGIDLRFPPVRDAAPAILGAVNDLQPSGDTPLTDAVRAAAEVLDYRTRPGVVVLVTDGKETCGGTPCTLAAELAADGLDLTVNVIGFKVRGDYFSWEVEPNNDYVVSESVARCLADRTGGQYVRAESVAELVAALRVTLGCNILF